jgi:hypothetical protein
MKRLFKYKSIRVFWFTKWFGVNWDFNVTTDPPQIIETSKTGFRICLFKKAIGINWNYNLMKQNLEKLNVSEAIKKSNEKHSEMFNKLGE